MQVSAIMLSVNYPYITLYHQQCASAPEKLSNMVECFNSRKLDKVLFCGISGQGDQPISPVGSSWESMGAMLSGDSFFTH